MWLGPAYRRKIVYFLKINSLLQIISPTALFLAAKVEEQPRKLEHVIKVAHACLHPQEPQLDTKSDVCGSDDSEQSCNCLRYSWVVML